MKFISNCNCEKRVIMIYLRTLKKISVNNKIDKLLSFFALFTVSFYIASNQGRLPPEFKHINKGRKRK